MRVSLKSSPSAPIFIDQLSMLRRPHRALKAQLAAVLGDLDSNIEGPEGCILLRDLEYP